MITKQEILEIPNSVLVSSMYATLVEVKHAHLNPHKQTDFDPHYLIKMLKDVLLIDVEAKLEAMDEEKQALITKACTRHVNDEQELNKHLQIINEMYVEKACKLRELANVRDRFYYYLTYFCNEASNTPEVVVNLETNTRYDSIRFNRAEAIVESPLREPISIYDNTHAHHLKNVKELVNKALEQENATKPE